MGFSRELNLEKILFRDSDIPFVSLKVKKAKINNDVAYLTVKDHIELRIKLPTPYVSNGNINIVNLLSAVKSYNQEKGDNVGVYTLLGKESIKEAIPQNDNKHNKWILQYPMSFNIVVSSRGLKEVYNAFQNLWKGRATVLRPTSERAPYRNSLWGQDDYIIVYQNMQQVKSALNQIGLASYILRTNNLDSSSQRILYVGTIAVVKELGVYEKSSEGKKYLVVKVKNYYDTVIIVRPEQYISLFSEL